MFHQHFKKPFLIILMLLAGCNDQPIEIDDAIFEPLKEDPLPKVEPYTSLEKAWYEKINLNLTKNAPIAEMIKQVASKMDLKISFNIKEAKMMNYAVKNKPFIEIISDICDMNDWKLAIKGRNAKISDDSIYMHSYSIPYLIGERKNQSDTAFSGGPGSEKDSTFNVGSKAHLSTNSTLDAFEELKKNIEMIALGADGENAVKFSIHKQAGVITIIAKQKVHKMIAKYINLLSKKMRNQILIEARIYEIELYEKFETGVDWSRMLSYIAAKNGLPITGSLKKGEFGFGIFNNATNNLKDFDGNVLRFLRNFGKVHSISNPRLMIANNNTGVFKVVDNKVFFQLKQSSFNTPNTNAVGTNAVGSQQNNQILNVITSTIHTVPIGIIVLVQPSIDESGKITIALKPTITEVHDKVNDPAISMMSNRSDIESKIPVVKTRELDTVFTTEENKVVVIGGLLYSKKSEGETGIPWLTGTMHKMSEKKEIAILIKAKLVNYPANYDELVFLE